MKIQWTLNDETLDLVIAQLRTVLEAPYFMYHDTKYASGKVTVYPVKDASKVTVVYPIKDVSEDICRKKRPMIYFDYNATFREYFFEGDTVISYGDEKVVVKGEEIISYSDDKIVVMGEEEKIFTKTAVTAREAEIIAGFERMNKEEAEEWSEFIKSLND